MCDHFFPAAPEPVRFELQCQERNLSQLCFLQLSKLTLELSLLTAV